MPCLLAYSGLLASSNSSVHSFAVTALVETNGLTKRFGNFTALDHCSFTVEQGETCGLLGPNGSGKTTLLRTLLGFMQPTAGWAKIDKLDCYHNSVEVHRRLAYLPGEARLPRRMRGRDVLKFFSQLRPDGNFKRSQEIAERLGLDLGRQVARCSTGMRQMIALSFTMAVESPLVILDEPTANLDPSVRVEILNLVAEARDQGRTVIFSSHVLSEVEQVCSRVIILRSGKLVHSQDMNDLLQQHRIKAQLTGELPEAPPELADQLVVRRVGGEGLEIDTPGELTALLGWLATLPLTEVSVSPIGLQTVYDRFHRGEGLVSMPELEPASDLASMASTAQD